MEESTTLEKDNPFTIIGLLTVIIDDLNNLLLKIESLEKYLGFRNHSDHS